MPLEKSVLSYVGSPLRVVPVEGWGRSIEPVPDPFEVQVLRFFEAQREIRAGVGLVISPRHNFFGRYVIFSPRHVGNYNFTDKLDWGYNLIICENDPVGREDCWPQPEVHAVGYAEVAAPGVG